MRLFPATNISALEYLLTIAYNRGMDISIVIPVFEESKKLAADIKSAAAFLESNHFTAEIIVVDDGSTDQSCEAAREAATGLAPQISFKVIRYENNRGKGYAIRTGIEQTTGQYVLFVDSGNCVPYENLLQPLEMLKNGSADIAHGSRKMRTSNIHKPQSLYRRIGSAFFHLLLIYIMKIPSELTDTQCGFKVYRGNIARNLYRECTADGFMFDIEMIMLALKRGYKIKEFPIEWTCDRDSRLCPARSFRRIVSELLVIRRIFADK